MALSCPGISVLIILVTIILVIFVAINLKRILKFFKKFTIKNNQNNLIYIDKSLRPVTVVKSAKPPGNKKGEKKSQLSPSPVINDINIQAQPIGTYLLKNTGSDNYQVAENVRGTATALERTHGPTEDTITGARSFSFLSQSIQGGGRGDS